MPPQQSFLSIVRPAHLYFGVFIAPALIFFAFTGFIQTFNLHETTRGSSYQPPKILVELGQLHKKQTLVVPARKPQPPADAKASDIPQPKSDSPLVAPTRQKNLWPMKVFFALVCAGLISSTISGLYMAYKYSRNTIVLTALWLAGIVLPALFTFF